MTPLVNHAVLALVPNPEKYVKQEYQKNIKEKIGDAMLMPVRILPQKMATVLKHGYHWSVKQVNDPQIITITLTATAMLATTYAFYPEFTTNCAEEAIKMGKEYADVTLKFAKHYFDKLPEGTLKFGLYLMIQDHIAGLGLRTLGRFSNKPLMDTFYQKARSNDLEYPLKAFQG